MSSDSRKPVRDSRKTVVVMAAIVDICFVFSFVLIGRSSHAEGLTFTGTAITAWPFLVGLAVGWGVMRAWRGPLRWRATGLGVWLSTVLVGFVLRWISEQGVQLSFAIVTTIFLGVFLVGWRAVAAMIISRRRS